MCRCSAIRGYMLEDAAKSQSADIENIMKTESVLQESYMELNNRLMTVSVTVGCYLRSVRCISKGVEIENISHYLGGTLGNIVYQSASIPTCEFYLK